MAGVRELVFYSYILEFLEIKRAVVLFHLCFIYIVLEFTVEKYEQVCYRLEYNLICMSILTYKNWMSIDAHFLFVCLFISNL